MLGNEFAGLAEGVVLWLIIIGMAIGALIIFAALLRWMLGISKLIATQEVIARELIRCRISIERLEDMARNGPPPAEPYAPAQPQAPSRPPERRFPFQA